MTPARPPSPDRPPRPALLSLADRVLQPGFVGTTPPDWIRRRLSEGLASVLLFGPNVRDRQQTAALTAALRAENPDVIVAIDEESGDITRLEAATGSSYPGSLALGTVDDEELTEAVARSVGAELRALSIDLDFAPDADVNSNPDNPVIGARSFGADPELVARHVSSWVRGLHSAGVAACVKHFPGHGETAVDSHLDLPVVPFDRESLAAVALPPFRAAIASGVRAVMTGHLLLPVLDPDLPATVSPRLITELLRAELGFEGLVVSDAVEMQAVHARYGLAGATVRALAAGVDLVCLGHGSAEPEVLALREAIAGAVTQGVLSQERLEQAAARVAEFGAWHRALAAAHSAVPASPGLGLEAARRAVRVRPAGAAALPLRQAPHLVEFGVPGTVISGEGVPWGLRPALAALLPGTTHTTLTAGAPLDREALAAVLATAASRPLVLAVRDAHRRPTVLQWIAALLAQRPDAVIVELGVPHGDPGGALVIATHGAARVCGQAAAETLAGRRLAVTP